MKTIVVSVLAMGAMTSVALAAEPTSPQTGPVKLTEAQMDGITAGQLVEVSRNDIAVQVPVSANIQACVVVERCSPTTNQPVNARAQF
jgi:hypothetical protein